MKEPPRKELRSLRITTKNEDQTIDRNNGIEARISRETTIIVTMGLGEIPPIITRTSPQEQTSHMGIIAQKTEDHLINAQINRLTGTMEIGFEMVLLKIQMGIGGTMEIFLVLHRPKGEIFHKITHTDRLEVINPTILAPADLTTDPNWFYIL